MSIVSSPILVKSDEVSSVAQSVRNAILIGIQPKMISKGSSGSYFARAKVEGRVQTVAYVFISRQSWSNPYRLTFSVFKPKDEEPYGRLNPKVFVIYSTALHVDTATINRRPNGCTVNYDS